MPLEPGDQLGPYKIQALLGVGGMGEVYRGRDTRLGRDVALKVISQKLVGDPSSRRRFEREARAASALNHPSIVTIYDVGETSDVSWIAMEWVEGRTLRQLLADGPLPIRDTWSIARQVADGLAAAHAKGIVHRDLKPENVMISAEGRAKILDFGLARQNVVEALEEKAEAETVATPMAGTFAGAILGTVGYMSPEQAAGKPADFRSDQFSFGLLIYELLAGRRAFDRPSAVETLAAVIREDAVPLASIRGGISDAMHGVLSRCLAKLPDERFPSTRDLAAALDSLEPESSARSAVVDRGSSTVVTLIDRPRLAWLSKWFGAAVIIDLVVVAALGLGVWTWYGRSSPAIESLAVLPFENAGKDPDVDYLSDGLTESLITHLSRVPSLKVMAHGTVVRFKGGVDPRDAGRQLGVAAVVTGTVTRRASQLVIAAELIDTSTGERLWAQTYDRPAADLLHVQDTIVSDIADGLRLRLNGEEKRTLGGSGTQNAEAYELYLKGRFSMISDTEDGDIEARQFFQQAIDKDPRFVEAHLGLASTYARQAGNGYAPTTEAWAQAEPSIQKALAIDPANALARAALISSRFQTTWDWPAAERDYRSILNDPRLFLGNQYHAIALFFWAMGRPEDGVALLERALRVDPGNLESRIMLGNLMAQAGRLDDALSVFRTVSSGSPDDPRPFFGTAAVLKQRGDAAGAIGALRKAYQLAGDEEGARALDGATTEAEYQKAENIVARSQLRYLGDLAKTRYVSPFDLARLHAQLGEREQAFASLDLALAERSTGLTLLKVDHSWDAIRADPRFAALVRRVGIP